MSRLGVRQTVDASIRPLRHRLILYRDDSTESRRAELRIKREGISPVVTTGPVEPLQRKPLVIYEGGIYEGLNEIVELLKWGIYFTQVAPTGCGLGRWSQRRT
jgi:hypothetical protein